MELQTWQKNNEKKVVTNVGYRVLRLYIGKYRVFVTNVTNFPYIYPQNPF